jgi:hypothetical protein
MPRHQPLQGQPEYKTMSRVTLTDVEWINLNVLVVIRAGLQYDPASTCCRYGLNTAQANHLRELSLDELWSLVIHVGDTTLFPPRADLVTLLSTPRALVGPMALARPPMPMESRR